MESLSDEELVLRYRETGKQIFLDELFGRYYSRVGAWCLRTTGDRESAADLAQEVFVKAYRNMESFRGTSKFGTWLYAISRNHCFNALRARAARPAEAGSEALEPLASSGFDDAYTLLEKQGDAALLKRLMNESLDEVEMRVMALHYMDELPLDAITRTLRLGNASGAKAHIVSARRKLAAAFARWKGQSAPRI